MDGDFGENTAKAVKLLQEKIKLPVTGVADENVWAALIAKNNISLK